MRGQLKPCPGSWLLRRRVWSKVTLGRSSSSVEQTWEYWSSPGQLRASELRLEPLPCVEAVLNAGQVTATPQGCCTQIGESPQEHSAASARWAPLWCRKEMG